MTIKSSLNLAISVQSIDGSISTKSEMGSEGKEKKQINITRIIYTGLETTTEIKLAESLYNITGSFEFGFAFARMGHQNK